MSQVSITGTGRAARGESAVYPRSRRSARALRTSRCGGGDAWTNPMRMWAFLGTLVQDPAGVNAGHLESECPQPNGWWRPTHHRRTAAVAGKVGHDQVRSGRRHAVRQRRGCTTGIHCGRRVILAAQMTLHWIPLVSGQRVSFGQLAGVDSVRRSLPLLTAPYVPAVRDRPLHGSRDLLDHLVGPALRPAESSTDLAGPAVGPAVAFEPLVTGKASSDLLDPPCHLFHFRIHREPSSSCSGETDQAPFGVSAPEATWAPRCAGRPSVPSRTNRSHGQTSRTSDEPAHERGRDGAEPGEVASSAPRHRLLLRADGEPSRCVRRPAHWLQCPRGTALQSRIGDASGPHPRAAGSLGLAQQGSPQPGRDDASRCSRQTTGPSQDRCLQLFGYGSPARRAVRIDRGSAIRPPHAAVAAGDQGQLRLRVAAESVA